MEHCSNHVDPKPAEMHCRLQYVKTRYIIMQGNISILAGLIKSHEVAEDVYALMLESCTALAGCLRQESKI